MRGLFKLRRFTRNGAVLCGLIATASAQVAMAAPATKVLAKANGSVTCDVQVPAGGTALADAIDKAAAGARLCLAAGEHVAGVALVRSVTLVGTEGAAKTVVKGTGRGPVLRVDEDGLSLRIEGLTLTGGVADAGGALAVRGRGKVHVADCIVRANKAGMLGGGGLYARAGLLTVERTTFEGNEGRQGGAVFLDQVVKADFNRCAFTGNRADVAGALRVGEGAQATVKTSTFAGNTAPAGEAVQVSGTTSRTPTVALQHCEVSDGGLVNGPEIPGAIRLQNNKLPASWRGLAGVKDEGGNSFQAVP